MSIAPQLLIPRGWTIFHFSVYPLKELKQSRDQNKELQSKIQEEAEKKKKKKITITNDKNRLSPEDIERMVNEAEKFADEDKKVKERFEAKNEFESYAYSLKNQIGDKDKLGSKLSEEDKKTLEKATEEAISWLESHADATTEELKDEKKKLEDVATPIVSKIYQQQGGAPGGEGPTPGSEEKEDKDEL